MAVKLTVRIGGVTLKDQEIEHVDVRDELSAHSTCSVGFTQPSDDNDLDDFLGERLSVLLGAVGGPQRSVFIGTVSGGTQTPSAESTSTGSAFMVEAVTYSVHFEHGNTAYFPAATVASIAHSLGATVEGAASTYDAKKPLDYVQYGETDFDFLLRIAEENGYFVRTSQGIPELHASFINKTTELHWRTDLMSISSAASLTNNGFKGAFYHHDEKKDHRFHQIRAGKGDLKWLGGASALVDKVAEHASTFAGGGDANVEAFASRVLDYQHFEATLKAKSARLLGCAISVHGRSTNPNLRAGEKCKLVDGKSAPIPASLSGVYGLATVSHHWDGHRYYNTFAATPWANYVPPGRTPRNLAPGLATAEVVQNEDTKHMGRLKLRFHWQDKDGQSISRWVRLSSMGAGRDRGIFFLPEVGDEVVVAFEQGDPERPVVVGTLWNGKDTAPKHLKGNNAKRIVTKSGNTVQFLDEGGKETIELYSAKASCFVQLANSAHGKPLVTVRSGGDISLEAEGEIRLKCASLTHNVSADLYQKIGANATLQAGENVVTKAGQAVAIEATNTTMKASANVISMAGGVNNLAGSMVQIQPPGLTAPPTNTKEPEHKASVWHRREAPEKPAPLKSTNDTRSRRTTIRTPEDGSGGGVRG